MGSHRHLIDISVRLLRRELPVAKLLVGILNCITVRQCGWVWVGSVSSVLVSVSASVSVCGELVAMCARALPMWSMVGKAVTAILRTWPRARTSVGRHVLNVERTL